jgi:hypothetical protein
MRISNVRVLLLSAPIPPDRRWTSDFGTNTRQDAAIVIVETDQSKPLTRSSAIERKASGRSRSASAAWTSRSSRDARWSDSSWRERRLDPTYSS